MQLKDDFVFEPLPAIEKPIHFPFPKIPNPLGHSGRAGGNMGVEESTTLSGVQTTRRDKTGSWN